MFGRLGPGLTALGLAAVVASAQSRPAQAPAESVLRSELSLDSHTVGISIAPAMRADDPAHRNLLASGGASGSRVRIGELQTTGALRVGSLTFAKNDFRPQRYELWLQGSRSGWQLGLVELPMPPMPSPPGGAPGAAGAAGAGSSAGAGAGSSAGAGAAAAGAAGSSSAGAGAAGSASGAASPAPKPEAQASGSSEPRNIGEVSLTPKPVSGTSPVLVASLVPVTIDSGQLVLRWGGLEASTDVKFTEPVRNLLGGGGGGQPNQPINRRHDEDTSAFSRILMLTQRNESALVVPKGGRLSVQFARTLAKGQGNSGSMAGVTTSTGLGVEGPDFARLMSTADGAVVELTQAAIPRLAIEAPVRIGKTQLRPGNQAPSLPGAYGMWLKRSGRGWHLVFSQEPDTWGSQYDKRSDVAEVELTYAKSSDANATRPFAMALVPTGADRGRLVILWGPHEWTTEFVTGG